jgi:uncharacterized coiled-coil protein SlyX
MSDFLETAKQKIGQGISRVGWEADKLRRVNAKQGEINSLKQEREQVITELSNTVLTMYRQGRLVDPQLQKFCERILDFESQMTARAAELEQIRSESYQNPQDMRANGTDAADPTLASRSAGRPPNAASAGPTPGAGRTGRETAMIPCPTCGESVRARALYCNKCGAKLR